MPGRHRVMIAGDRGPETRRLHCHFDFTFHCHLSLKSVREWKGRERGRADRSSRDYLPLRRCFARARTRGTSGM
jgi:hypothetical protein